MTSKIQRQKHIFSMLNSRIVNDREEIDVDGRISDTAAATSHPDGDRLVNQIFHFHKSIIQHINVGLITIDPQGDITFANRSAAQLLGLSVAELPGRSLLPFFANAAHAEKVMTVCLRAGRSLNDLETRFHHASGRQIVIGINASYFNDDRNRVEGTVLILRDLTDVHQMRSRMERMERLALLGELSAGIAHEIRNPLGGIKAGIQVMQEQGEDPELRDALMGRVVKEVDKANALLKEFFKFARPMPPSPAFHELEPMIEHVHALLAPRFRQQGVQFRRALARRLPRVFVDEAQLEQVLMNLFLNALDVLPDGGVLEVSARRVPPGSNGEGPAVEVRVADDGPGIPEDHLGRVFNPFFTTKPGGVGLGLSICSRLIDEQGGKLDVDSVPGDGACFRMLLPAFRTIRGGERS